MTAARWDERELLVVTYEPADESLFYTDAEFAAAFRPAEHLDRLLDAARAATLDHIAFGPFYGADCNCDLCEALRQWEAS